MTEGLGSMGKKLVLRFSKDKKKRMKNIESSEPITFEHEEIKYVDRFSYLGSNITMNGGTEEDIILRIGKATGVTQRLRKIWLSRQVSLRIKMRLLRTAILPTPIYGCESWKSTVDTTRKFKCFPS